MHKIERLEAAVHAALRLRRSMTLLSPIVSSYDVPKAEVERFDKLIQGLKDDKQAGSNNEHRNGKNV